MANKIPLFLPLVCALIASCNARIQEGRPIEANAIPAVKDTDGEGEVIPDVTVVHVAKKTVEDILTSDQWPTQEFKPLKEAETKEEPIQVIIPSMTPVQPPTKFINEIQFSAFNIPNYPHGADQRVEYYSGTYGSGENEFAILVKKSIHGYENVLYQEAQILQALSNKPHFPQLIQYDGRNLTMTALCSTWTQYTAVQFQSGGMDLEDGYNMMHQMLDALKELHSLGYVHRDISADNIAFGCHYYKDVPELKAPFRLSETSKLYLHEFGATENIPMFVQDAESLGYVFLYGMNGGLFSWTSTDGTIRLEDNIAKKAALDLDENLSRMKGDEPIIAKARRSISKYFSLIREHTLHKPKDLLDYEALKAYIILMNSKKKSSLNFV
ncbi:uncharacterized protein LOC129572582 isoform X2 [Sitodiplosis mosellana]|uniref:uncharacterized protein LOC129572582 isoform X2 n=1 Tax=Sitodiplosis mosellana TaxID=263140 RepID=UPI002444E053|nr:uncharacterized protein LOC129572582 isoform X2 [Sitodiplosis mosellana]